MICRAGLILGLGMLAGCIQSDSATDSETPPDMRTGDRGLPSDMMSLPGDAAPGAPCPQAWSGEQYPVSPRERCQDIDIFDSATCTDASAGLICQQSAICEPAFFDPGSVVACCEAGTWITLAEEPDLCGYPVGDMAVPDPIDQGVDAGPAFDCSAIEDPRGAIVEDGRCDAVDIFNDATCTPGTQLVCAQTVTCDPPVESPGEVISCCDGGTWVRLEEEPDLCGLPPP